MTIPGPDGSPKYDMDKMIQLYEEEGRTIFPKSALNKLTSCCGLRTALYPADGLRDILNEWLGDAELKDTTTSVLIPTYDIIRRVPMSMTTFDARKNQDQNVLLRDAALATSSAPTYLPVAEIHSMSGIAHFCIDGGLCMNNPAAAAVSHLRGIYPETRVENIVVLSLGTGFMWQPLDYKQMKKAGKIEWVQPVIDIAMSGSAQVVHQTLEEGFSGTDNYVRIQPVLHGGHNPKLLAELDNVNPSNIHLLRILAETAIMANKSELERIAAYLVPDPFISL